MCVFPAILSSALSGPDESSIISKRQLVGRGRFCLGSLFLFGLGRRFAHIFFSYRLFAGVFQIFGVLFYLFYILFCISYLFVSFHFKYKEHFGVSDVCDVFGCRRIISGYSEDYTARCIISR